MTTTILKTQTGNATTGIVPANGNEKYFWVSESTRCLNEKSFIEQASSYSNVDLMGNFIKEKSKS
ncbi:hypothetical protein J3L18_29590 [Mucilaginibacter gossypii]|uniref:hypothetical protein n=1 Tax=Mucilaginibacter gossypii TaxID=551996 RepID=UPI00101A847A|nr:MULTISPECIES: hypothetical protein [Mucilaginibacter]QTE37211.1 hypothetical protein J3L18_29590 [Mucilaginibacter gossypii]